MQIQKCLTVLVAQKMLLLKIMPTSDVMNSCRCFILPVIACQNDPQPVTSGLVTVYFDLGTLMMVVCQ